MIFTSQDGLTQGAVGLGMFFLQQSQMVRIVRCFSQKKQT